MTSANSSPPLASDDRDAKSVSKNDIWVENSQDERPTDAMAVFLSYEPEYRRQVEKQLLRKIDTRILPLIMLIYLFNYLDRNSITQARLYGLEKETGLEGAEYQTAISIFSAGYILMQLPATILMTKLRPSIFLVSKRALSFSLFPLQALSTVLIFPFKFPAMLYHSLGDSERVHVCRAQYAWSADGPVFPRVCGSPFLPRCSLLSQLLVHEARNWCSDGAFDLWYPSLECLRRTDLGRNPVRNGRGWEFGVLAMAIYS